MAQKTVKQVLLLLERETPFAEEDMAEFLVDMCSSCSSLGDFKKKLEENDAPFEEALIQDIYKIVSDSKPTNQLIQQEPADEVKIESPIDLGNQTVVKTELEAKVEQTEITPSNGSQDMQFNKRPKEEPLDGVDEFGRSIETRLKYEPEPFLPPKKQARLEFDPEPVVGKVYRGKVTGIKNFGVFIRLEGIKSVRLKRPFQGLCHISQLSHARIEHPTDLVSMNEIVYSKVLKFENGKTSLSMKGIDQNTGEEQVYEDEYNTRRLRFDRPLEKPKRKLTSPERWELRQLVASGAISLKDHPELEEDLNELAGQDGTQNIEEDVEIDIEVRQKEPKFISENKTLKKALSSDSTDIQQLKVSPKPDGSLGRAAMTGSELARELKEKRLREIREKRLRQAKQRAAGETVDLGDDSLSAWQNEIHKSVSYGKRTKLPISEQRRSLPVFKLRSKLIELVRENQFLVIVGETGSGKTTQLTQYLMEEGFSQKGIIGCTQPRRVAAISVAKRVAEEVGCSLGSTVGYTVRFEERTSPSTQIKYMTDGMLQREALRDPAMSRYSVIMLDEAHERTIATDVLFALLKTATKRRPDLKVIVTSATLDSQKFSRYFNDCPVLTIPGRTFPVEILYTKAPEPDYLASTLDTVLQIHALEGPGDILVFLTGQEEIDMACEALFDRAKKLGDAVGELIVLPVYSSLPSEVQSRIFEPAPPGARKCVVATNIAETSITIDGIFYVVDPGFVKLNAYDPKLGMDLLVVTPISQAQANQRAGRAGRTGPGKCYRLYTENAFKTEMAPNLVPEIQRQNLSNTILMLKAMGIEDLISFEFMDPPPVRTLMVALEDLFNLSALDDEGHLTDLGRRMSDFPMDPALARALISSTDLGCSDELCTIVSMLSVQNVFYRPKNKQSQADLKKSKFHSTQGDHITLLNVYTAWTQNDYSRRWCEENYIQDRAMKKAREVRKQLVQILTKRGQRVVSCGRDYDRIRKALCSGFFKNSAKRSGQEPGAYSTLIEDTPVYMHPSSALFGKRAEHVIYHTLLLTSKEYMHCVTTIEPRWLVEVAPTFFQIGDPNNTQKKVGKIHSLQRIKKAPTLGNNIGI